MLSENKINKDIERNTSYIKDFASAIINQNITNINDAEQIQKWALLIYESASRISTLKELSE